VRNIAAVSDSPSLGGLCLTTYPLGDILKENPKGGNMFKSPNYFGKCMYCDKEFSRYIPPSDLVKDIPRCCSTSCKSKYQWKDRKLKISDRLKKCKHCGKEFVHAKRHKKQKFCSLECANAPAIEKALCNNRVLKCKHCKEEFIRDLTDKELKQGKGKYCSRECHHKHVAWEQLYCEQCGKPLKRGYGERFCSKKCWGLSIRSENGHINPQGYILMTVEDGRRVLQHRYVMEQMLGRELFDFEKVHHKNGKRADNEPENLELWLAGHPAGQRLQDIYRKDVERLALENYNLKKQLNPRILG